MKKIMIFLLTISSLSIQAQNVNVFEEFKKNYKFYWDGAKFLLGKTSIDPIVNEIIEKSLPKIADKDVKGAILEVSNVFYEKKDIKALNPDYLKYLEKTMNELIPNIGAKKWGKVSLTLCDIALVTNSYFTTGKMENSATISDIVDETAISNIDKKVFVNRFNDYSFYYKTDGVFIDFGAALRKAGWFQDNETINEFSDNFLITNYDTTQSKYYFGIEKRLSKYTDLKYFAEMEHIRSITNPVREGADIVITPNTKYVSSEYMTINNRKFLKQTYTIDLMDGEKGFNYFYYCIIDKYVYTIAIQLNKKDLLDYSLEFELILNNLIFNQSK